MSDLLTVVLILKDRSDFTKFQMAYFNHFHFPYPVIIADGVKDEEIKTLLRDKKNFPNVNYEYIDYPYDSTASVYYRKMTDVAFRVTTPFSVLIDNDDFYLPSGLDRSLEFLIKNPGYTSARGSLTELWYSPTKSEQSVKLGKNLYGQYLDDITGDSAGLRMLKQSQAFHGNWHNVIRTSHLQATLSLLEISDPTNLRFAEQIVGFLNTIWGNSHRNEQDYILCCQNSERVVGMQDAGQASPTNHFCKIFNWINHSYWVPEFSSMTDVIAASMAHWDKVSLRQASEAFRVIYAQKANVIKHHDLLIKKYKECEKIYDEKRVGKIFEFLACHDFYKSHRDLEGKSFDFDAGENRHTAQDVVAWIEKDKTA
mgnify:FL=1